MLILTDYTGLSSNKMNELRSLIKKNGSEYMVVKNRLLKRAFSEEMADALGTGLTGPTALALGIVGAGAVALMRTLWVGGREERGGWQIVRLIGQTGYLLAGFAKRDGLSTEGAIKYFLLGSFSSAIFLFGLAYVWAFTGTTRVSGVSDALAAVASGTAPLSAGLAMGLAFLSAGVAFKIAAVPFHYWTPDAYQGSPTPVTGYLSVGPKIAAFALILRLFVEGLGPVKADWAAVVIVLAVVTMTLGNLVALTESNVKRMLAYSSIAHTGYILVGLAAYAAAPAGSVAETAGLQGVLFYAVAYTFMNLGAFGVVILYGRRGEENLLITDYSGMGSKYPLLAVLMAIFMFSLAGIPPTAGFVGKFYIFSAAVKAGYIGLAVIGVLNSALSVYFYLRITVMMYMRNAEKELPPIAWSPAMAISLFVAVFGTLQMGITPAAYLEMARKSILALM
jgi:NADH-quinone oxidoreductase subunit N